MSNGIWVNVRWVQRFVKDIEEIGLFSRVCENLPASAEAVAKSVNMELSVIESFFERAKSFFSKSESGEWSFVGDGRRLIPIVGDEYPEVRKKSVNPSCGVFKFVPHEGAEVPQAKLKPSLSQAKAEAETQAKARSR